MGFDNYKVELCLEAVYYYSAREHFENAQKHYKPLKKVIDTIFRIDNKIEKIEARYKNKLDAYDEVERYCIQLDSYYTEMTVKYMPVIRDIALVHIINALCLEAYINVVALEHIELKSSFKEFDKLSLEGKWLFFPKLIGKYRAFKKDMEPFQGFKNIIRWRNNLVHFKGKSDPWRGYLPPQFFDQLGLTMEHAEKSCIATKEMVKKLCSYCGINKPKWIGVKYWSAFSFAP